MKIAILEPYIKGVGGAQKVIAEYALYLKKKGHEVEIFTMRYDSKDSYDKFKGLKITTIGPKASFLYKLSVPFVFLFKKFEGFDKVLANDWPTNFASIRNKNVDWVCYSPKRDFYDLKEYYRDQARFIKKISLILKRAFFKNKDLHAAEKIRTIFAISDTIRQRVKKYYGLDSKIFYPGIDFRDYSSGRYDNLFLSVARFVKPKRIKEIIDAMSLVKNKDAKLHIIGDGPDKKEIMDMCRNKSNIVFVGKASNKKLKELYKNCRAAVYVPKDEDWGLIPIEAAACKKTTIGSNEGGLKENIKNGKTGFLIDNPSPEKIAQKIDLLASNKKLAEKMGKEAYEYCRKFDWKNILPGFERNL